MIKKSAVIISIITAIVSVCNLSWAYHGSVHYKINEAAVESSQLDLVLKNQLGIEEGTDAELKKGNKTKPLWKWIADGGKTEDYGIFGEYDFLTTRAFNHFHDPLRDWDEAGLYNILTNGLYSNAYGRYPVSSVLWGLKPGEQDFFQNRAGDWSWEKARGYYYHALIADTNDDRDENFADCSKALGQVLHLLQDMSVSLHTRNDAHVLPLKIPGTEFYLLGKWNYETYTKEYKKFLNYSAHPPDPVLLTDPQPQSNYSHLVPISGLFDRNQYNEGSPIPVNNNILGLAEYSNANFLTEDTMWDYQHPSLADTDYDRIDWLNPEPVDAEDGKVDNRIYIKKDVGEQIDHLAAIKYWAYQLNFFYTPEIHYAFLLDEKCWKDYADKLIPRAVGYSAGLLDYFFRGTLEITAPEEYVHSIVDGSITPHEFIYIKAKVRNTTPDEVVGEGIIQAVARYKKRTDYQPDLSTDPPTDVQMDKPFSYSVSAPIEITSLNSTESTEYIFDFTQSRIPAGITDLYLHVIFKGTLGNETDNAIAVGMKDLNEPEHLVFWNNTDYFLLDGVPRKAEDIENDPNVGDYGYIYPYRFTEEIGFSNTDPDESTPIVATIQDLPPARYSRLIVLVDDPKQFWVKDHLTSFIDDATWNFIPLQALSTRKRQTVPGIIHRFIMLEESFSIK